MHPSKPMAARDPGRAVPASDYEPHKDYRSDVKPEGFEWSTSRPVTQAGAAVLLVQDTAPWGMVANEEVLGANGITFDRINSSLLATTDLSAYRLVIVSSDQPTSFYATFASYQAQVDAFVAAGGTLEFHAAGWGWRGGNASLVTLPGGMRIEYHSAGSNVEMAEAVVGGAEKLRQNPYIACYINATSGLLHNEEALQKLIYLAGKGLPSIYVPVCYGGLTAPVTLAGTFAATNAGVLAGLVISQLVREGAPYIVPGWGARTINMRSGAAAYFTSDDKGLMAAMGHYYGLPMFGYGGFSDSKLVDQQAALEAALSLAFATIEGANLIHDLGYLEAGRSGSLAQLVLCDEVISCWPTL